MVWLKKEILFILSIVSIAFTSCENISNSNKEIRDPKITKEKLVSVFFSEIQNWNDESIEIIDSLGGQISKIDSSLTFLPYQNEYESRSFIFTTKDIDAFQVFEESTFLNQTTASQQSSYKVWRKKLNELQILDISIEPHPTLDWIFVIRLRGQE